MARRPDSPRVSEPAAGPASDPPDADLSDGQADGKDRRARRDRRTRRGRGPWASPKTAAAGSAPGTGGAPEPAAPDARPPDWKRATAALSRRDPVLRALIRRVGPCTLAPRENSFGALAGAIVAQQISAAAATTIHTRLWNLTGGRPPTPEDLLRRREPTLRRVGLSRQKIAYLRDLARRVRDGVLDLAALPGLPDEEVRRELTAVRGIGRWTADMHLIFTLNRPDVFAPGDAAVLAAMRDLYRLPDGAPAETYEGISARWRPYRSIGVWYMYEHLHALRAAARGE